MSRSTADFLIKARQLPPDKVKVVYLGVPLEEFSRVRTAEEVAAARAELGLAPGDFAVGTVTRLHDSKGNSFLVDAARLVLDQRPHARFFVVGEGPLRPALEQQAQALGLGDRFVFAGFARDIPRVVSAFDLSVFPSLWEGTPLTVFEALAMGKPILATDADGLVDVLRDGHDAVIVPKRDARALASGMVRLIDDPDGTPPPRRQRPDVGTAVQHRRVRPQDGAAVRPPASRVPPHPPARRIGRGSLDS